MIRRYVAVAVVAVALLALFGAATPAIAADDGTATTTARNATETPAGDATLELVTDGDRVVVRPADDQTVRGRTSLSPGTELSIRIRSSGESQFLKTKAATVGDDGTFAATFDFDGLAEDAPVEAEASVRTADGDLAREYEAVVRSASTTESTDSTTGTTSARVPGFGAATAGIGIAVTALAAALLRTRRTD